MTSFKTNFQALVARVEDDATRPFLHQPIQGDVISWTRSEALDDARRLANALLGLGLQPGDRVAILSKNCAEWVISDIAISLARLVSVPIYPTAGRDTITYVLEHSGSKAIIVGRLDDPASPEGAISPDVMTIGMRYESIDCDHNWRALIDAAEPIEVPSAPEPADVMTILYTSGSTGKPKGVVISYEAFDYASETTREILGVSAGDRVLSYLPLAHITERTVVAGPAIYAGTEMYFTESIDTFLTDLKRARPTHFVSVPRLWVQFQAGVHKKIPPKRLALLLSIPIIRGLIARRIREQLGFDSARVFGCGSAPVSPLTLRWYEKIGVKISEGWGMSETSGLSCTNRPFRSEAVGTIGLPLPGTEMKTSEEGEILIRCPGLFSEYYKQPELTASVFDEDGFFHTGDRGEWDAELGAFRITGRVKELFKSAKGKYVSPVPIEGKLAGNPLIEQVCVTGAGLRAPVALVVPSVAARSESKEVIKANLEATLATVNAMLESHEKLDHVYVVNEPWTIENDLLTPTLKIKRDKLEAKYGDLIRKGADSRVVWVG